MAAHSYNIPVPFQHQPELRALLPIKEVPEGHLTFPVWNDRFEPHLHEGELVVVDTRDREPEHREYFVIAYDNSRLTTGYSYEICETVIRDSDSLWSVRHGRGALSEGPMLIGYLRKKLVGRIVGFHVPLLAV